MRRAAKIHKFEVLPDARFNNVLVTRFINALMIQGKKSTAERIFYGAVDIIEKKIGSDGLTVVKTGGGSVEKVDVWGRRRLAFDINKKHEGIYAVVDLTATPALVQELDRQLNLNEAVLRTKVIRPDIR